MGRNRTSFHPGSPIQSPQSQLRSLIYMLAWIGRLNHRTSHFIWQKCVKKANQAVPFLRDMATRVAKLRQQRGLTTTKLQQQLTTTVSLPASPSVVSPPRMAATLPKDVIQSLGGSPRRRGVHHILGPSAVVVVSPSSPSVQLPNANAQPKPLSLHLPLSSPPQPTVSSLASDVKTSFPLSLPSSPPPNGVSPPAQSLAQSPTVVRITPSPPLSLPRREVSPSSLFSSSSSTPPRTPTPPKQSFLSSPPSPNLLEEILDEKTSCSPSSPSSRPSPMMSVLPPLLPPHGMVFHQIIENNKTQAFAQAPTSSTTFFHPRPSVMHHHAPSPPPRPPLPIQQHPLPPLHYSSPLPQAVAPQPPPPQPQPQPPQQHPISAIKSKGEDALMAVIFHAGANNETTNFNDPNSTTSSLHSNLPSVAQPPLHNSPSIPLRAAVPPLPVTPQQQPMLSQQHHTVVPPPWHHQQQLPAQAARGITSPSQQQARPSFSVSAPTFQDLVNQQMAARIPSSHPPGVYQPSHHYPNMPPSSHQYHGLSPPLGVRQSSISPYEQEHYSLPPPHTSLPLHGHGSRAPRHSSREHEEAERREWERAQKHDRQRRAAIKQAEKQKREKEYRNELTHISVDEELRDLKQKGIRLPGPATAWDLDNFEAMKRIDLAKKLMIVEIVKSKEIRNGYEQFGEDKIRGIASGFSMVRQFVPMLRAYLPEIAVDDILDEARKSKPWRDQMALLGRHLTPKPHPGGRNTFSIGTILACLAPIIMAQKFRGKSSSPSPVTATHLTTDPSHHSRQTTSRQNPSSPPHVPIAARYPPSTAPNRTVVSSAKEPSPATSGINLGALDDDEDAVHDEEYDEEYNGDDGFFQHEEDEDNGEEEELDEDDDVYDE